MVANKPHSHTLLFFFFNVFIFYNSYLSFTQHTTELCKYNIHTKCLPKAMQTGGQTQPRVTKKGTLLSNTLGMWNTNWPTDWLTGLPINWVGNWRVVHKLNRKITAISRAWKYCFHLNGCPRIRISPTRPCGFPSKKKSNPSCTLPAGSL